MHKRVILAVPWSREILAGIAQYLQTHERWWIDSVPHWSTHLDPDQWRRWDGDGVIIQATSRQPLDVLLAHPKPAVSVSDNGWDDLLPSVHLDNHAIGQLGADYFLRRGFRHLMFAGALTPLWSQQRWEGFESRAREAGACVQLCRLPIEFSDEHEQKLQRSLVSVLKPVGVMADCDVNARMVARVCLACRIRVPEELAILGVDNDTVMCDMDLVPLSSIAPDAEGVGYRAAAMLDQLMQGGRPQQKQILVPPGNVITRRSTDVMAVGDADIARAVRYIWDHILEPITVDEIAEAVCLSRRNFDRRFRQAMQRTPADEITMVRLERARRLLRETTLPMSEISRLSGFTDQTHLGKTFRRTLHITPVEYRKQRSTIS